MATNGKMNATKVKAQISAEAFVNCINVGVRLTAQRVARTTKDSEGYLAQRPGIKSGTVTLRGYVQFNTGSSDQGVKELEALRSSRTMVPLRVDFGGTSGDKYLSANARMTSFRITGGTEQDLEVEASFQLTGTIQWLTVTP